MNGLVSLIVVLFLVFSESQKVLADNFYCPPNPNTALGPGGSIFEDVVIRKGSGWGFGRSHSVSATLTDCKSTIPNYKTRFDNEWRNASFDIFWTADIDANRSINVGGLTYYKIRNTSSTFLNTHAFIYFKVRENNPESPHKIVLDISKALNGNGEWLLDNFGADRNFSPHVILEVFGIHVYFDQAPAAIESAIVHLGTAQTNNWVLKNNVYNHYKGRDEVYLTLNVVPEVKKTCNLDIPSVTLSQISVQNSLDFVGAEADRTAFTIKANCSEGLENTALYYSMGDNANPKNYTDVLTNTEQDTKSVGIKVYDATTNQSVFYNKLYNFGVLSGGLVPSVSKQFYARYYRKDNDSISVGVGNINAQATISVTYK